MSAGLTPAQSTAVLHLVQRLLTLGTTGVTAGTPPSLEAAAEGNYLYEALRAIQPAAFPPLPASLSLSPSASPATTPGEEALVRGMSAALQGAVESVDGADFVLAAAFPRLAAATGTHAARVALVAQCFTMTVVLSGSQVALQQLKLLSREDQVTLSALAKHQLQTLGLRPRPRRSTTPPPMAATAAVAERGSGGETVHTDSNAALPPNTAAMVTDVAYYHRATMQLRKELSACQAQIAQVEARCLAAEETRDAWCRKYQLLLGNDPNAAATGTSTNTTAASPSPSVAVSGSADAATIELLKQRCAEKDSTIDTLTAKVEAQTTRLAAFKETLGMHEAAVQALRRKLKAAEEGVMAKATECRRLQEALSVCEDKLSVQFKARTECENTIESLQSQLTVLRLTQQENEALEGHEASHMPNNLSGSFASNGSIDRVVLLENEMDEMRAQRDALQKQLGVLQRQVATLPPPMADTGAVHDTLKAHVRLLEKEKEELQQQLSAAMAQVEAAAEPSAQASVSRTPTRSTARRLSNPTALNGEEDDDGGTGSPTSAVRGGGSLAEGPAQRKQRNNTRRDQTILSSLLLEYGYQNLLLQQHNVLLHRDALDAAEAQARRAEENDEMVCGGAGGARVRGAGRAFAGSFLTRQRREIEEGLLESIIHGRTHRA